jgi:ubiquinone/menaquinone biosynthesis C-methylase UbiE
MDKEQVEKARQQFDLELHTTEYRQTHGDKRHLDDLLKLFKVKDGGCYLDIGTGDGYLAFEIVNRYSTISIEGLDITAKAIARNNQIARQRGMKNVRFRTYDGFDFPFTDKSFNGAISRYALHHFPDINRSIREINRILKKDGFFILSDPQIYDLDSEGFIDKYQKLKQDGHNHFYYEEEICTLFKNHGFARENIFYSTIRYPRKYGVEYQKLLKNTKDEIIKKYAIERIDRDIFITVQVMNILFRKKHNSAI